MSVPPDRSEDVAKLDAAYWPRRASLAVSAPSLAVNVPLVLPPLGAKLSMVLSPDPLNWDKASCFSPPPAPGVNHTGWAEAPTGCMFVEPAIAALPRLALGDVSAPDSPALFPAASVIDDDAGRGAPAT